MNRQSSQTAIFGHIQVLLSLVVVMVLTWTNTFLHDIASGKPPLPGSSGIATKTQGARIARLNSYLLEHSHNPTTKEDVSSSLHSSVARLTAPLWTVVSILNFQSFAYPSNINRSFIAFLPGQGAIFPHSPPVYIAIHSLLI